ncbi:MAG TPA: PAS domain S-box protein [Terracidiphilus sp.]|nr:PAS domain S-box protein [Terracidiphilus sp.]
MNGVQTAQVESTLWLPEPLAAGREGVMLLEALFNGHPDMVILVDEQGRIVAANPQVLEGFGYSREELEGQSIGILLPETARERHAGYVAGFIQNPTWRNMHSGLDLSARDSHGTDFQVDVMLRPFHAGGRQYGMAILRRLDTALTRSRAQVRAVVESLQDYSINLLDAEGRILTWNEGARRIHGLTASQALGQHVGILYPGEESEKAKATALLEEAAHTGRVRSEGWWRGPNGSRLWAEIDLTALRDDTGRLCGFTRVLHDLTRHKQIEDRLRALNAQLENYRIIVENVEEHALYSMDRDGLVTSWGQGTQKLLGFAPEEVLGKHYSLFASEEDRKAGVPERDLEEAARSGRCFADGWRLHRDGRRRWWSGVITALRDEDGKLIGFVRAARDITRQKELEESLEQLNADLEARVAERTGQLEATILELRHKNEEVESFSRIVSRDLKEKEVLLREIHHRVKNNLQVVQSLLKMSARELPECEARSAVESTVERVHAMSMVHEKLYQMPSLSALPLSDYLSDIFTGSIQAYSLAPSQVQLKLDVEEILLPLDRAVPFALLANELLSNSFKHGFPGGRRGAITVSVHRIDGAVRMIVEDDGVGLPAGFDAAKSNSMGLKLAVSLAHQLGGRLQFTSENGCRVQANLTRM